MRQNHAEIINSRPIEVESAPPLVQLTGQWGQYAPAAPAGPSGSRALVGPFGTRYDPRHATTAPPDAVLMARVHAKHTAGRVLDGRTWDEFPEVAR